MLPNHGILVENHVCMKAVLAIVTVSSPTTKYATRSCIHAILVENLMLGRYRLPSMLPDHAIVVDNLVLGSYIHT